MNEKPLTNEERRAAMNVVYNGFQAVKAINKMNDWSNELMMKHDWDQEPWELSETGLKIAHYALGVIDTIASIEKWEGWQ